MKEVLESLAGRVLEQAVATNRLANAIERRENSDNMLRQELSKLNTTHDEHRHEMRSGISKINERLGIISKDVDDSTKFQIQAALKPAGHEQSGGGKDVAGVLGAFGRQPKFTQILIAVLIGVVAAAGWLKSLL